MYTGRALILSGLRSKLQFRQLLVLHPHHHHHQPPPNWCRCSHNVEFLSSPNLICSCFCNKGAKPLKRAARKGESAVLEFTRLAQTESQSNTELPAAGNALLPLFRSSLLLFRGTNLPREHGATRPREERREESLSVLNARERAGGMQMKVQLRCCFCSRCFQWNYRLVNMFSSKINEPGSVFM